MEEPTLTILVGPMLGLAPIRLKRIRGIREEASKTITPSTLHKFCKNFDVMGDPNDHVAQYRQLLFVKGVKDIHNMVQAFGISMKGRALAWFQI